MLSRTVIDRLLTAEERQRLIDYLLDRYGNPTGKQVRAALEELGLYERAGEPSHNSINTWMQKSLKWEIHRQGLRLDAEIARYLVDREHRPGGVFAEANRDMAQAQLFLELRTLREDPERADKDFLLSLMGKTAMLDRTDVARQEAEAKLEKMKQERDRERKAMEDALAAAEKKEGPTADVIQSIREKVGLTT